LIWKFCKAHRPSLIERAKELQPEACEIVRRCFNVDEFRAFWYDTNIFTRHFREAGEQQGAQQSGPQAPIVAFQQHQQALDLGAQDQYVWGQQELFPTGEQGQMRNATPVNRPNLESNTNIPIYPGIALNGYNLGFDNSGNTEVVQTPAQQWTTNGQPTHLLPSDPNWALNAVPQNAQSSGFPDLDDNNWGLIASSLIPDYH
jgi:hypothetical protein